MAQMILMRILIVEDSVEVGPRLAAAFRKDGFAAEWAPDGETALQLAELNNPNLVVLDLDLPGISGLELLKLWTRQGRRFPVLVASGRSSWRDRIEVLNAGADGYLVKPFLPAELVARARLLLGL